MQPFLKYFNLFLIIHIFYDISHKFSTKSCDHCRKKMTKGRRCWHDQRLKTPKAVPRRTAAPGQLPSSPRSWPQPGWPERGHGHYAEKHRGGPSQDLVASQVDSPNDAKGRRHRPGTAAFARSGPTDRGQRDRAKRRSRTRNTRWSAARPSPRPKREGVLGAQRALYGLFMWKNFHDWGAAHLPES